MFGVPLHSLVIHFPIALGVFAFVYDAWAVYSKDTRLHLVGSSLLKLSAASALAALGSGVSLAGMSGLGSRSTVTGHAGLALTASVVLAGLAFARYSAEARASDRAGAFRPAWLAVEGAGAILVTATAILGHRI